MNLEKVLKVRYSILLCLKPLHLITNVYSVLDMKIKNKQTIELVKIFKRL